MQLILSRYLKALELRTLELITGAKAEGKSVLVIVPSQASFLMEKQIIERAGGFCDIEVMSFEKLTRTVLDRTAGRTAPRLDSVGTGIRVRRAMSEHEDELSLLRPTRDEDLHMSIASSISSLSSEGIGPDKLRELAENANEPLKSKLSDIAVIMSAVGEMGEELSSDETERFAASLFSQTDFIKGRKVIIHGFELLTESHLNTVFSLLKANCEVTVSLEADENDEVFTHQNKLALRLEAAARAAGQSTERIILTENVADIPKDIAFLEDALYSFPPKSAKEDSQNIEIIRAVSAEEQAEAIVSRILAANAEGIRLREIGILCPGEPPARLKEALSLAKINFSSDGKRSLAKHRLCGFVLGAVRILYNGRWSLADVTSYLKTRIILNTQETDSLLKYADEHGLKGSAFRKPFDDEEAEALRARAFAPLELLKGEGDAAQICLALKDYILSSDIPEKLAAEQAMLEKLKKSEEARFTGQVCEKVCSVLTETAASAKGMDKALIYPLLHCGFSAVKLSIVPPRTEEIVLGDISHSIFPRKKLMIIANANDGLLPSAPPSGLFSVSELEKLNEEGYFPGLSLPDDQRIYIRRALTSGSKLIISYDEHISAPSAVIERVMRIFENLTYTDASEIIPCAENSVFREGAMELRRRLEGEAKNPLNLAAAALKHDEKKIISSLKFENSPRRLAPETAAKLYGEKQTSSVSRIEKYKGCPYSHFIEYGLKPQRVVRLEEDSRMAGIYVHGLLDEISRAMKNKKLSWAKVSDEQLFKLTEAAAKKLAPTHNGGFFTAGKRAEHIAKRLEEEVLFTAAAIRSHMSAGSANVDASELRFGENGELQIFTDGADFNIKGTVDRVDIACTADGSKFLRIVDYKTGDKKYSPSEVYYGISIQLIVYLMAAMKIYEGCIPAGGFYFKVNMPFSELTDDERFKEMRMNGFLLNDEKAVLLFDNGKGDKLISMDASFTKEGALKGGLTEDDMSMLMSYTRRLITEAVGEIYSGRNDIRPYTEITGNTMNTSCDHCDYRSICRFDESCGANNRLYAEKKGMADIKEAERR